MWRVHDRIAFVSGILKNNGFSLILTNIKIGLDEYTGWFKIRAHKQNASIFYCRVYLKWSYQEVLLCALDRYQDCSTLR